MLPIASLPCGEAGESCRCLSCEVLEPCEGRCRGRKGHSSYISSTNSDEAEEVAALAFSKAIPNAGVAVMLLCCCFFLTWGHPE